MIYDKIKIYMQYILPKHLLTLAVGFFASAKLGKVTTFAIEKFVKFYDINTSEMQKQISDYTTFNHFFARALKKGARPINQDNNTVISPVDGKISQYGSLIENLQIQAKNHYFTTDALLASLLTLTGLRNFNGPFVRSLTFGTEIFCPIDASSISPSASLSLDK